MTTALRPQSRPVRPVRLNGGPVPPVPVEESVEMLEFPEQGTAETPPDPESSAIEAPMEAVPAQDYAGDRPAEPTYNESGEPISYPEPAAAQTAKQGDRELGRPDAPADGDGNAAATPPPTPGRARKGNSRKPREKGTNANPGKLVVIQGGTVTYSDDDVHVLDLDNWGEETNAYELTDALTGLADVADSSGKTAAVEVLLNRLRTLTVGH